ncbi:MAG: cysteine desulfurase [Eggerthellaceae bacterium]|nr:cysteine desulfurase [Eggerthellaceae bacterium]
MDYAAGAPICESAKALIQKYLIDSNEFQANPNSVHDAGRAVFSLLEEARKKIAQLLGADRPYEIVFCSGATEANNAALFGIGNLSDYSNLHLIISNIEHPSVIRVAKALRALGAKLDYVSVDSKAQVREGELKKILHCSQANMTRLVSIQYVNSEIGAVQNISNLARLVKLFPSTYFHCDATQALGKVNLNLDVLGIDAASFSAHKIGACKSSGCLYIKNATPFKAFLKGGGQENGKRSGTQEPVFSHIFAEVLAEKISTLEQDVSKCYNLRKHFVSSIDKTKMKINFESNDFVPNIINVQLSSLESQTALLRLSEKGIYVSTGSACSSHSLEPSHVLRAIGLSTQQANSSIRISFNAETTKEEIDTLTSFMHSIL